MPAEFSIELGDQNKRVSVETLAEALKNALVILRNVGDDLSPAAKEIRWEVVHASMNSPLILAFSPAIEDKGRRALGERIVETCIRGIEEIGKTAESPKHFNQEALLATKRLQEAAQEDGAKVAVSSNGMQPVTLSRQTVDHINQVSARARPYSEFGTIEGTLELISVHKRTHLGIWESFDPNRRVHCEISSDRLDEAKTLLGKRVAVSGTIHYANHRPTSIEVEAIRRLREVSELPQAEDIPPLNITGGLRSEDYVRRLRDAQ